MTHHYKAKILVALGGNAIKQANERGTDEEQFRNIMITAGEIVKLLKAGYFVTITHGNGPQVGNLMVQQEAGAHLVPPMPMDTCGAMTQGQIGFLLQHALSKYFHLEKMPYQAVTVVTRVLVSKDDPDFKDPSKPVGDFMDEETMQKAKAEHPNWIFKKVKPNAPKPWRRVVPSPDPIRTVEAGPIKALVDAGFIVIASGGGGIPVKENEDGTLDGVEGVIDKDLAGERLAEVVRPDILMILTDVEKAYLNFGKPDQKPLDKLTIEQAKKYLDEGHFLKGSMGPKVKAAVRFMEIVKGKEAIITSLDKAVDALDGKTGTHIVAS
ncbi:MAG: carbamate kinase [Thermoplasmata archaeon]